MLCCSHAVSTPHACRSLLIEHNCMETAGLAQVFLNIATSGKLTQHLKQAHTTPQTSSHNILHKLAQPLAQHLTQAHTTPHTSSQNTSHKLTQLLTQAYTTPHKNPTHNTSHNTSNKLTQHLTQAHTTTHTTPGNHRNCGSTVQ
jgi:hypothetical protein